MATTVGFSIDDNIDLFHNTSTNSTPADMTYDQTPNLDAYYNIWRDIYFVSLSLIIPLGLIFNSVSFCVFWTSWMRTTIPGCYFMVLAFADNVVLFSELLLWLNTMDPSRGSKLGITFFHSIDALCKVVYFFRYGSRMWSSWVIVSITIERFITVTFPLKVLHFSSPRKVIAVVAIEAAVCFGLALFPFFTLEVGTYRNRSMCLINTKSYRTYHYLVLILMAGIGELILPSVLMSIFTALIIRKLYQAQKTRWQLSPTEASTQRRSLQPTIALVIIAITFVIIRLPYIMGFFINQYSKLIFPGLTPDGRLRIYAFYNVAKILAVTNYAINFFLFCMAGSTFREEVRKCCCLCTVKKAFMRGVNQGSSLSSSSLTRSLWLTSLRSSGMKQSYGTTSNQSSTHSRVGTAAKSKELTRAEKNGSYRASSFAGASIEKDGSFDGDSSSNIVVSTKAQVNAVESDQPLL